jgi:hypothetical protein
MVSKALERFPTGHAIFGGKDTDLSQIVWWTILEGVEAWE